MYLKKTAQKYKKNLFLPNLCDKTHKKRQFVSILGGELTLMGRNICILGI